MPDGNLTIGLTKAVLPQRETLIDSCWIPENSFLASRKAIGFVTLFTVGHLAPTPSYILTPHRATSGSTGSNDQFRSMKTRFDFSETGHLLPLLLFSVGRGGEGENVCLCAWGP